MSRTTEIACAVVIVALSTMGWLVNHYYGKYQQEQKRADTAEKQVNAAQTITANVMTTMTIFNSLVEANQHAKEQIALDASGASADIRVAVANDDCTNRPVPAGAVKRLQQYANGLRQSAGGSVTGQPDD
ncbi:MAG: DUF2570 domain-containing protein [Klebsiella huaxiensis]|uniref:DUF2570 domain-containing protein n=1 Tax=Klebsiella huaxiensis TaxID=2153354 RepID=UPI0026EDC699|nr:DUF2570 domain-containing protein [Klebsiella huaxiensis]WEJ90214.1 MAG: DUF2570 domain-containing protein [Klebsiella huaxiensis]